MTQIVVADIGGTHARFARARLEASCPPVIETPRIYRVADYPSLSACWQRFARDDGYTALPDRAAIAFAGPVTRETIRLTNSNWVIRRDHLARDLGLTQVQLVNDFEAVAHAVSRLSAEAMPALFGPDLPMPHSGTVTVIGPGTGLGVAMIAFSRGKTQIIATEGSHMDFPPLDALEDGVLASLRRKYLRVSNERIISGPGLNNLYAALAEAGGGRVEILPDADLWGAALDGSNRLAREALHRFCLSLGAVAGDLALAHGAHSVVLAGGLMQRLRDFLVSESGFHGRFTAKGRSADLMRAIPVRLATLPDIGLLGAATAWRNMQPDEMG